MKCKNRFRIMVKHGFGLGNLGDDPSQSSEYNLLSTWRHFQFVIHF